MGSLQTVTLPLSKRFLCSWNSGGLFRAETERHRREQRGLGAGSGVAVLAGVLAERCTVEMRWTCDGLHQATSNGRGKAWRSPASLKPQNPEEGGRQPQTRGAAETEYATGREVAETGHSKMLRRDKPGGRDQAML